MNELVEKVAKAICKFNGDDMETQWRSYSMTAWHAILATLEGIREPSKAQREAGEDAWNDGEFPTAIYSSMIDALIKELKQ